MQLVNRSVNNKSMARIVPPLEPADHIGTFAEPVNDLTFSFIAPLGAYDNDIGHGLFPISKKTRPGIAAHLPQRKV